MYFYTSHGHYMFCVNHKKLICKTLELLREKCMACQVWYACRRLPARRRSLNNDLLQLINHVTLAVFENQDKIVIVMEYASGGELYNYLESKRGISDEEAKVFFAQIVSAVRYCHKVSACCLRL